MRALFQAGNFLYWVSLYFCVPILSMYAQGMGASVSLVVVRGITGWRRVAGWRSR